MTSVLCELLSLNPKLVAAFDLFMKMSRLKTAHAVNADTVANRTELSKPGAFITCKPDTFINPSIAFSSIPQAPCGELHAAPDLRAAD